MGRHRQAVERRGSSVALQGTADLGCGGKGYALRLSPSPGSHLNGGEVLSLI